MIYITHIKPLSRRSVTGGIAAALAAIPSVGLCNGVETDALERIKHHTRELEKAMRDCYGVDVESRSYAPTKTGMKACIFVIAHTS